MHEQTDQRQQGSRITFQLPSPVASDRCDPLARTNFLLGWDTDFLVLLFSSCQSVSLPFYRTGHPTTDMQ